MHKGVRPLYALKLNLPYSAGIADSWFSGRRDLWVEFKYYVSIPKKINLCKGKKPKLSKLQQAWLTDRHDEGRHVAVVIACQSGAVVCPGMSWKAELTREEFVARLTPRKGLIEYIVNFCNSEVITSCH